jgi:hypothetical protein
MLETANTRPGKAAGSGCARRHEVAQAQARRVLGHPEQLAAADVVAERRQPAGLHRHEEDEARPLGGGLPERRVAFEGRVGGLQVRVRHHAEHVVGRVVAPLHPAVDVVAALDLPFVDVGQMAERREFPGDPVGPVPVAARVADEYVGHAHIPASVRRKSAAA